MKVRVSWQNWSIACFAIATMTSPVFAQSRELVFPAPILEIPTEVRDFELSCPFPAPDADREGVFEVDRILAIGNTILHAEIEAALNPYENREITFETLTCLVEQIIPQLYRDRGYITTGAFLPQQAIDAGIVRIEVIEGTIAEIAIEGLHPLREADVGRYIQQAITRPFHLPSLDAALQALLQKPFIESIEAELNPRGDGTNTLCIRIREVPTFHLRKSVFHFRELFS